MKQVSRYHPLLVTLHWVLAVLIIAELTLGFWGLAATPNSDPEKIGVLRVHMPGGVLILALMGIRASSFEHGPRDRRLRRPATPSWIGSRRSPTMAFTSWSS